MSDETKMAIDSMSYEAMLSLQRNARAGHPYFQYGEISDYFQASMKKKREEIGQEGAVAASKSVGWDV